MRLGGRAGVALLILSAIFAAAPSAAQSPWTCSGTLTNVGETLLAADASAHNSGPDFRASDSRVAYAHGTWPGMEIWTMGPDGANKARLTTKSTHGDSYMPAWSPDGTKIAYTSNYANGGFDVWTMNADGSGKVNLASNSGSARWSPDGSRLIYFYKYSASGGERDVYVMNANGSGKTALAAAPGVAEMPGDWSPDGQRILFTSNSGGSTHIYRINPDGSGLVQLTSGCASDTDPRYSPDGKRIAFTSDRAGTSDIWVMDADGTNMTRLTTSPGLMGNWRPDGQAIAFQRNDASGWADLYRLDLGCAAGTPAPFTPVCQPPSDTTPPGPVTNLANTTYLTDQITWAWTNPTDADFSKVMVYIDGVFATNTTGTTYTATGLAAGTSHTITLKAVDTTGNIGDPVSHTATTAPVVSACSTVLSDDFNDGDINGWTVTSGSFSVASGYAQAQTKYSGNHMERALAGKVSSITYEFDAALDTNSCQAMTLDMVNATGTSFAAKLEAGCFGSPPRGFYLSTPLAGSYADWPQDTAWHHFRVTYADSAASLAVDGTTVVSNLAAPASFDLSKVHAGGWNPQWSGVVGQKVDNVRVEACAAPAPPPPSSTTGWLVATSSPMGVPVYVDGGYVGDTPATSGTSLNATVAAGKHTVTMTLPGFADCVKEVEVVADRANPVHCNFQVLVTPQISGSDLVLSWPAVSSASYMVHKTTNKFGWNLSDYTEVSGTSATLAGAAAETGTEYYLVRTVDPLLGELESQLAFKTSRDFAYQPGKTNLFWISLPYGGSVLQKASDVVAAIEPLGGNSKISMVAKWDPAAQSTVGYGYVPGVGWMGTDFPISPGDGLYLYLSGKSAAFSWPIADAEQNTSRAFTYQSGKTNLHWVSVPFASKYALASDIVAAIEPLGGNSKISMVAKWDPAAQSTVGYGYVPGVGWMGTDFSIAPGDGVYLYLSGKSASFEWTPELALP